MKELVDTKDPLTRTDAKIIFKNGTFTKIRMSVNQEKSHCEDEIVNEDNRKEKKQNKNRSILKSTKYDKRKKGERETFNKSRELHVTFHATGRNIQSNFLFLIFLSSLGEMFLHQFTGVTGGY